MLVLIKLVGYLTIIDHVCGHLYLKNEMYNNCSIQIANTTYFSMSVNNLSRQVCILWSTFHLLSICEIERLPTVAMTTENALLAFPLASPLVPGQHVTQVQLYTQIRKDLCRSLVRVHGTILSGTQQVQVLSFINLMEFSCNTYKYGLFLL